MKTDLMISKNDFLQHWLGHRELTRKAIAMFPEQDLFSFSVGGMRPFADLTKELLSLAVPGLKEIATGEPVQFNHNLPLHTKEDLLKQWDEDTPKITEYFNQIPTDRFEEKHKLFGMYEFTIRNHAWYLLDNEVHHRAQGYVYLRALGIEPPPFWDRQA